MSPRSVAWDGASEPPPTTGGPHERAPRRDTGSVAHAGSVFAWVLVGLPLLVFLLHLPRFGRLPYDDYYWALGQVTTGEGVRASPAAWLLVKSNEHSVVVPVLLSMLNIGVTHGDNRGLSTLSLLLLSVVAVVLFRMLPAPIHRSPWLRAVYGAVLGTFVFTTAVAHNVVLGFSGVAWFTSNACAVTAMAGLSRASGNGPRVGLWRVLLPGGLGALSYSTNLALWPALLVGVWLYRLGARWIVAILIASAAVGSFAGSTYHAVPEHPVPNLTRVHVLARFVGVYLGAPFAARPALAALLGFAGLSLGGLTTILVLVRGSTSLRSRLAPWIMLQAYGAGNALITAVFRSGAGESAPTMSRYASIPVLFWIGVLVMLGLLTCRSRLWSVRASRLLLAPWMLLVAGLAVLLDARGLEELRLLLDRAAGQPLGALALVVGVRDAEAMRSFTAYPEEPEMVRPFMKRVGHVPFDRPTGGSGGARVDAALLAGRESTAVQGDFETLRRLDGLLAKATGWVYSRDAGVAEVLLLAPGGIVRGSAVTGIPRQGLLAAPDGGTAAVGWAGYAKMGSATEPVVAHVRLSGDARLWPLPHPRSLAP